MTQSFGPSYFRDIPFYGLGLGMNPADAHDLYLAHSPDLVQYIEITATSSRHRGPYNYGEVRRMASLPPGFHYWKIDDYPAHIKRIVHSTNINPVYPEPITADAYAEIGRLVTLTQSPWVTEDLGIWLMSERHVYPFFMPLPLQKEALAVAIANIHAFQSAVGVPFNAEFPPISVIAGEMHAFEFFRILVEETGCGMCLDIGHILSYQLERGVSPTADLHLLPWQSITEIHLAGGNIDLDADGFHYDDTHGDYEVVTVCYDMLDTVIHLAPNLRAITVEIFGSKQHHTSIQKLRDLQARPSVQHWLNRTVPTFTLPTFAEAAPKVQQAVLSMHDVLHGRETLDGATLEESGREFLDLFASRERKRWDYERQSRVQLQGLNLASYFPLTTRWLLVQQAYADPLELYAAILKDLPGHSSAVWEKVQRQFAGFVLARADDSALAALFDFETWMNECVMDGPVEKTRTFALNVLALASALNKRLPREQLCPAHEQITLAYTGQGQFGLVGQPITLAVEQICTEVRGKNQCCTGE